ncbi:TniQ family protein [Neorhizobium galegae]|uniref:TniQ family protein n=1 Tax=Neorhizobium galegae TaxID=399 RepID=UPI0021018968|nr:TniQ family protein [Neorhizobium galegae]MCQ1572743.1 TniQ family protein [Neorhizobium galegae]
MDTLHVTVDFKEDESFASFVSRVAAANGTTSAQIFCQHMGLQFQALVDGDPASVTRMLQLCGQSGKVSAIGIAVRDERTYTFGMEVLLRSNMSRRHLRVCPHCLEEDEAAGTGPSGTRAYGRLAWLSSFVRTCAKHQAYLIPLPEPVQFGSPHDFAARVRLARDGWDSFRNGSAAAVPSTFERYVEDRLLRRPRDVNWMDEVPLYAAGKLTETVGAIINHGRNFVTGNLTEAEWIEAGRSGFEVTSAGPTAFAEFLRSLHDRFWNGDGDFGGRLIYGRLYEMLAHENEDPVYDPIRDIIRETAVASLPIGPDHLLFGKASPRRWHSVHSATKEFGLHHKTARKMFAAAGLIPPGEETADSRTLVDALEMETFVRRWQSSLKTDAAMERVNIGRSSWDIVLKEGYVKPLIEDYKEHGVAPLFPLDELERFVARLETAAPPAAKPDPEFVGLTTAAKRASTRLSQVLEWLFQGALESACIESGDRGFEGVRVSVSEVFEARNTRSLKKK